MGRGHGVRFRSTPSPAEVRSPPEQASSATGTPPAAAGTASGSALMGGDQARSISPVPACRAAQPRSKAALPGSFSFPL